MILTDTEIQSRMAPTSPPASPPAKPLFENADNANVRNCGYVLRAGRVFAPQTGEEVLLASDGLTKRHVWEIGPAQTLIVMTEEMVYMPSDLCASYTPLNRLATKGVMLLNSAIVEPGYSGPLSCFLLNFSSMPISLEPKEAIAKIVFHKLNKSPANLDAYAVEPEQYARRLAQSAKSYQKSFLDVAGIEDRAVEKARSSLKGWVIGGGVLVSILVLFASMEPLLSKWFWEKTGVTTATQRVEDATLRRDLEAARDVLRLQTEKVNLENQIREIRDEIDKLKSQAKQPRKR